MKKAIVIAITMILGLGLTAFAGPLSGSWASSLVVDPAASSFTSLSSTLAVDYTVSGWTFGSSSSFTLSGFSSQSFTAGGSFGAFTLSSTMTFDPMAVTGRTYTAFWGDLSDALTQTSSLCPITYTKTTEPMFLTWTTEGSVSIGGVEIGALFYIDQSNYDVTLTDYATTLGSADVDRVLSDTTYICDSGVNGSGWRVKVAGTIGDITATSYTYFNLNEADASTLRCPAVGKSGTLTIASADCTAAFTEQYVLLEGIALGCTTIDAGLSILCTGFDFVAFVVEDVVIGEWLELDFGLTFALTEKSYDFCLSATMPESDCLTIEFGLNNGVYPDTTGEIDSINFYGIGFTYAWEAVTFTSYTEISANSALFSTAGAYDYIYNSTTNSYLIPYVGRITECDDTVAAQVVYFLASENYYELDCVYTERYRLWEKFMIEIDGDACCGGVLDLTISTWFGDYEELAWYAYYVYPAGVAHTVDADDIEWLSGSSSATGYVQADEFPAAVATDYPYAEGVVTSTGYATPTTAVTTLFNWAQFGVDASVGVASNITLELGFDVSAFGWESLDVGFTFEF